MFKEIPINELIKLIMPLIIIQLGLVIFSLYKLTRDRVKYLPKWAWAIIIICVNLFGAIIYLLIGRERD